MKSSSASLLLLLTLCALSCSKTETPDQVLRRLMESKMKDGQFKEANTPGKLNRIPDSQEAGVDQMLQGSYRLRNEFLIVTILNDVSIPDDMSSRQEYFTGVFTDGDASWKSLFETDLVPGRLDTLFDLNNDGILEFVLDEFAGTSAGFESHQVLYAKKSKSYLEKIDTLSMRFQRSGVSLVSNFSLETQSDETVLMVGAHETSYLGDLPAESYHAYSYRWQPPQLIKEELHVSPQEPEPSILAENMAGFPNKWFPLTESEGKLKRQQVCGGESFIEIIWGEKITWHEQGFDNAWEATIDDFTFRGEGGYAVQLILTDGSKKEIVFVRNFEVDFVYTIDGRSYTAKPESFEIVNDKEECGD